ncbi:ABC transporter substrate-binding protein [Streptomyces sp. NPDC006602]|uniref:ABC transporter substrate-binding protein n=1 Tax=Streptomyces sp. NPDC006602 TaxID=3364751 RepID=UPI00368AA9E5
MTGRLRRNNRARAAVTVAVSAGLLAGCGGSSNGAKAAAAPTDHVLHASFLQDPGQPPDPDIYYAGQGLLLTTNLYEGLLQYRPGTDKPEIVSDLATSFKASPDNKAFTFQLRHGVKFHDGTPFTAAAVKPSFDRRLAVNQGPAYMVSDVASVTTQGDYEVTVKLKHSNAAFPAYLASAYGPRMMSPTGLVAHAGKDHAQTYLRKHDLGTGPYTLTDARVGTHYAMKAFAGWWGPKPYFTSVDMPVYTDPSAQQLALNKGQLAIVMHDLSASAVQSYRKNTALKNYSMQSMNSDFLYVNPHRGMLTSPANRSALLQAIDADALYKAVFTGRADKADQAYPARMMPTGEAEQGISHDPSVLSKIAATLPAGQRTLTIGYDSQSSDNQTVANLISAQLSSAGLTVKIQAYPTSQIFTWPTDVKGAPDMLLSTGWPDAAAPYTWAHISYEEGAGLNYMQCSTPQITKLIHQGLATGSDEVFSKVGTLAAQSGCWENLVNQDDFMVAQPWLKGVKEAHVITAPFTLSVAALSAG